VIAISGREHIPGICSCGNPTSRPKVTRCRKCYIASKYGTTPGREHIPGICSCGNPTSGSGYIRCRTCYIASKRGIAFHFPELPLHPNFLVAARLARFREPVLQYILKWSENHGGRSPSVNDWNISRPSGSPSIRPYVRVYGSWSKAVEAAGLVPLPSGGVGRWAREASKSTSDYLRQRNRQMVTAGAHTVKKPSFPPPRLMSRHPRRNRRGKWWEKE
jgi:hypothetical protein